MGKIKQWIVAHKLWSIIIASVLVVGITLSIVLPLALSHKHVYGESWEYNESGHYHTCSCGHKSTTEEHDWELYESLHNTHTFKCSVCDKVSEEDHVYESDTATECLYCEHTRMTTTLAFKAGGTNANFTYNGEVQTFNKENLVSTNVFMDYVIVEYSLKGSGTDDAGERIWTTQPKDAGDYFIRVRVEADDNYTGLSIDTLEDTSKQLRIQPKTLSLENLVLAYTASELGTSAQTTLTLTSKDIDGLCGSDTLQVILYKTPGASISAGDVWTIKEYSSVGSDEEKTAGLQIIGNYNFSNTSSGKLYVANGTTDKTSTIQEVHESATAHIDQNGRAYYYAVLRRARRNGQTAGEPYATYYSLNCTNNAVKVVEAFTRSTSASAKLTEDGQLLVYGTSYNPVVIIGIEYKGTDTSGVDNTFKLVESTATRTVDSTAWGNALTFADNIYSVTLKKNGETIEEGKYAEPQTGIANYYKKDANGETYYSVISGENYQYYIFEQNEGVWARRSLTSYYDADEATADAFDAIKLNSAWFSSITTAEAFANFTYSLEDLMYHTDVEYTLNGVTATNIALRFANGKLIYAEFTSGDDKYTIKVGTYYDASKAFISLPIKGAYKNNAIAISYADSIFSAENVTLYEGDNWFVIDVTAATLGDSDEITGTLTTSDTSKISGIVVMKADGTALTNDINDEINEFDFENITAGKYYIKVTLNSDCTGSWDIGFVAPV